MIKHYSPKIQTIITMFTEDKVTELFCIADNFCKFFAKMRQNIR